MKKIFLMALLAVACMNADAQYKKASFLSKSGRTYDLGGAAHLISANGSMTPGVYYSYGKDGGEKRFFHWFDLELLLPSKYSYKTTEKQSGDEVEVTGKTALGLLYRYNLAYYLMDNTNEANKLLPFVTTGFNMLLTGGKAKYYEIKNPAVYDVNQFPSAETFSAGLHLGVGAIYKLSSNFGIKATGGYNYQYNMEPGTTIDTKPYFVYQSHPYITLGVRFVLAENN